MNSRMHIYILNKYYNQMYICIYHLHISKCIDVLIACTSSNAYILFKYICQKHILILINHMCQMHIYIFTIIHICRVHTHIYIQQFHDNQHIYVLTKHKDSNVYMLIKYLETNVHIFIHYI